MSEKTVLVTEKDGKYQIQANGISDFALIGILECVLFDLKAGRQFEVSVNRQETTEQTEKEAVQEAHKKTKPEPAAAASPPAIKTESHEKNTPDLRTRISNAVKAIRNLGGEVENIDLSESGEDNLQALLNDLTDQYKRLKNSKSSVK
jgi:hypothetical protein